MVGCCKFGPCRKKRTYEFNNPPYTENKEDGVYHSHKQKLTQTQTQNGSAAAARTNPAFESASTDNVEFNRAAVVDLDSECNSIAEEPGAIARKDSKHKENAEGFKSADLVVKRKDSKRSSKSSHSSSSSSSKSSKRSSKHSADVVVVAKDNVEDNLSDHRDEVAEASVDDVHADVQVGESYTTVTTTTVTTTTTTETHEPHGDEEVEIEGGAIAYPEDEHHDHDETTTKVSEMVVIKREEITTVSEDGAAVTRVEVTEEVINDTGGGDKTPERRKSDSSHSSSSSSSSDANSYRVNEDGINEETQGEHDEEVSAAAAGGSTSDDDGESSGGIELPLGIEELDNEANDMVEIRDGSYTVTHVTEEVTVNAHGDDVEHGDTGSEDL